MNCYKNKVAWCPICVQGWVEICKDQKTGKLFVLCDECESVWKHPDKVKNYKKFGSVFDTTTEEITNDEDMSIFEWDVEIQQPSNEEIRIKGWEKSIIEK